MKKTLIVTVIAGIALALLIFIDDAQARERGARPAAAVKHASNHRVAYFHPVGHRITVLPKGHRRISVRGNNYYFHGGHFYRPSRNSYVVVAAPIGARVRALPAGWVSFGIGTRRFFYVNTTFFLWDVNTDEYVVVEEPEGAAEAMETVESQDSARLIVYPGAGQSEEQTGRDRYECYLWAVEATGYDRVESTEPVRSDYTRAMSACLEGRGYTVQ